MGKKTDKKRIILVIALTFVLCAGVWYGSYSSAALNSYAVTEEEKEQAQKEADEAKAAAEAKKKEAKAAGKKAAEATKNIEEAEEKLTSLQGQIEQTKADIQATIARIEETKVRKKKRSKSRTMLSITVLPLCISPELRDS